MKRVLFIDARNTARSRMAEVWFNRLAAGWGTAESCGTMPAKESDPYVAQVMREVGVDVPNRAPKAVKQELLSRADVVVILGQELSPQAFAPARLWDLPDPAGYSLAHYRLVRDAIFWSIEQLVLEIRTGDNQTRAHDCRIQTLSQSQASKI